MYGYIEFLLHIGIETILSDLTLRIFVDSRVSNITKGPVKDPKHRFVKKICTRILIRKIISIIGLNIWVK